MNNIAAGKNIDDTGESLNNVDKVLKSVGLSLRDEQGQIRDLGDVLDEIAAKWDTYTRNQQNQISTAVAGTRQANYFKAAMADWEEVLEGTNLAMNATGSAEERMGIYADSLQGKLNSLKDSFDEFVMGLEASDTIKSVVDILTGLLNILDLLINDIPVISNVIKTVLLAQGINVLIGSLKQLKALIGKTGFSLGGIINFTDVVKGFKDTNSVIKKVVTTTEGATVTTTNYSIAIGKAANALVGFISSNPAVAVAAITAVVAAGAIAWIAYSNSIAAAEKKYENLKDAAANSQAEVDSVNNELSTIDSQIEAINDKGTLTLTDKEELKNLESQRKELELTLATKQKIAEIDAKEEANAAEKVVNKKYKNQNFSTQKSEDGKEYNQIDLIAATSDNSSIPLETKIDIYDKLNQKKEKGIELADYEKTAYDKLEKSLSDELNSANEYLDSMETAGDTTSQAYQKVLSIVDAIQSRLTPEEWKSVKLSDLIDSNDSIQNVKTTIDQLKDQLSYGLIDENTYKQKLSDAIYGIANDPDIQNAIKNIFGNDVTVDDIANTLADEFGVALNNSVDNIDISSFDNLKSKIEEEMSDLDIDFNVDTSNLEDVLDDLGDTTNLNDVGNAIDQIGESIENYKSEIDSLSDTYNSLGANVDNAVAMLDAINEDMDALTGQTQLTGSETQDLIDKYSSLGTVIDVSTGQAYSGMDLLNQTILNTGASAGDMQNSVQSFMGGVTNAGNNTITAMNYVLNAIVKVKQALASALNAAASFVDKASTTINKIGNSAGGSFVSKIFGIDKSDISAATNGLSSVADSLRDEASSITNSIQTEQAMLIQQTQQYQTKLQNAGKAGQKAYKDSIAKGAGSAAKGTGAAKDATEELVDALKEQYEAEKKILDQKKEALEAQKEALNDEKEGLEDAQDAINDLLDMTMDMLKQQYEDEKDALDKQLDAFEDKINKQKEYLDLQRQEQEHQDELAEKNQAIADIQAELNEIQFDNSAEAQKRRLELLNELTEAQKELSDYQADYDYDTKNDALDKELDSYKEMIDQKKQYISDTLEDEYNLYLEAIGLIEGRSSDFYNRLVEWNRVYGDHLTSTVKTAWDACYEAMDEYGYLGVGVQGILEGIATRTAEIEEQNKIIENSIKSIENELDILKNKYDAATEAAKAQAEAANEAASAANNAANAANNAINALNQLKSASSENSMITYAPHSNPNTFNNALENAMGVPKNPLKMYHTGTDYVKKASSWLDDMLGLKPDETAAVLKVGEAVIPDYANPFGNNNYSTIKSSIPSSVSNSNRTEDNSIEIRIGDIVVQGDADESILAKLQKERKNIVDEIFKKINKHSFLGGYKNVRIIT